MNACDGGIATKLTADTVIGKDCSGAVIYAGASLATCDNLNNLTNSLTDKVITGLDFYDGKIVATVNDGSKYEAYIPKVISDDGITVEQDSNNDWHISTNLCDLSEATVDQANNATEAFLIGCVDGAERKIPLDIIPKIPDDWSCIPTRLTVPTNAPDDDEAPFALVCGNQLYVYTCEEQWVLISSQSADNEEFFAGGWDTSDPPLWIFPEYDVCNLRVNVHYKNGDCTTFREMTIASLASAITQCGEFHNVAIQAGDNITVTDVTNNGTTTYTISADTDQATLSIQGNVVTLTNEDGTSHDVDLTNILPVINTDQATLTLNGSVLTIANEDGTSNDVDFAVIIQTYIKETTLAAGNNVTVTPTVTGNVTNYEVSAIDSKTVVAAGSNVTVVPVTSGDTTTYTISSTATGSSSATTSVSAGTDITVTPTVTGNNTNYEVNYSGTQATTSVVSGTNADISSTVTGNNTEYTVNASFANSTSTPITTNQTALPTTLYGTGRAAMLAEPDIWAEINVGGTVYLMPLYIKP